MHYAGTTPPYQTNNLFFNESEDRFHKIFLASSDALFITDEAGTEFLDANPRACQALGYSRRELLRLSPGRILALGNSAVNWGQWAAEKTVNGAFCRQKSGLLLSCEISGSRIKLHQRPCVLLSLRAKNQRQLADMLRKTSAFTKFLNALAIGVAEAPTIEHAIRFCIHQVCDFCAWPLGHARILARRFLGFHVPADIWYFGLKARSQNPAGTTGAKPDFSSIDWYPRMATSGRPFISEQLLGESEPAIKELARSFGLKSALVMPLLVDREVVGTLEFFSSETIKLDHLLSEIMTSLGARVGRIIEEKRVEARIENLTTKLFHVQDDERRRLARDLHDTTAQHIAAILMDLNLINRHAETLNSDARIALTECISLARQSLYEVRTFSYLLHPPMLDELGLVSALRIFIEGFSERSGMKIDFEAPGAYNKLPTDLEVTIFQVVQEGLTNAYRHSGSPSAKVQMSCNPAQISISVENETTREFSTKGACQSAKMGVGLRSLQERVEHFGGRSTLHCNPYRTLLRAVFPLSQPAKSVSAYTPNGGIGETNLTPRK
jgi:PAS domain S-box-containing protein